MGRSSGSGYDAGLENSQALYISVQNKPQRNVTTAPSGNGLSSPGPSISPLEAISQGTKVGFSMSAESLTRGTSVGSGAAVGSGVLWVGRGGFGGGAGWRNVRGRWVRGGGRSGRGLRSAGGEQDSNDQDNQYQAQEFRSSPYVTSYGRLIHPLYSTRVRGIHHQDWGNMLVANTGVARYRGLPVPPATTGDVPVRARVQVPVSPPPDSLQPQLVS